MDLSENEQAMGNVVTIYKYIIPRKKGFVTRAALLTLTVSSLILGWRLAWSCNSAQLRPTPSVQLDHFRINRSLKKYLDNIKILIEPSKIVCPKKTGNMNPMLVLVTSSPSRIEHRKAIRNTWAPYFPTYFIMGLNGSTVEDLMADTYSEAKIYSDVIIYKFQDHYQNLTLKTALMIEWTLTRCSTELLLFKTDDDVLVNPWLMKEVVKEHLNKDLIGYKLSNVLLYRDANNKWYIPRWLLYSDLVEEYLSGTAYLINGKHFRSILEMAYQVPLINIEDIYFTYLVAKRKLGLTLTHDRRLSPYKSWLPGSCMYFGLASVHSLTPEQILRVWPGIQSLGKEYQKGKSVCTFSKIFWRGMFLY